MHAHMEANPDTAALVDCIFKGSGHPKKNTWLSDAASSLWAASSGLRAKHMSAQIWYI
jgi:hypothetical protein